MQFTSLITVVGARALNFQDKENRTIDITQLHVLEPIGGDNSIGQKTSTYSWGKSSNFHTISGITLPNQFDAVFEMTKRADGSTQVKLLDLKLHK